MNAAYFFSEWGSDLYTPVDTCVLSEIMSPENFGSDKKYFIEFFLSCNLLYSY